MSNLAHETCLPCRDGSGKLSAAEIGKLIASLQGWEVDGVELHKRWKFKNFVTALAFVNRVGEVAEAAGHHPDIALGWGYANIRLTTHDAGGLTRNDFIVAAKLDALAG